MNKMSLATSREDMDMRIYNFDEMLARDFKVHSVVKWGEIMTKILNDLYLPSQKKFLSWEDQKKAIFIKWNVPAFAHHKNKRLSWFRRTLRKLYLRSHLQKEQRREARFETDLKALNQILDHLLTNFKDLGFILLTGENNQNEVYTGLRRSRFNWK